MLKKSVLLLVCCLCVLALVLVFSPAVTRVLTNVLLSSQHIRVGCLDYRFVGVEHLQINQLCVEHSQASLRVANGQWSLLDNQLLLKNLTVKLKPAKPSQSGEFVLPKLPVWLPVVEVDHVVIQGEPLKTPLIFALTQPGKRRWVLKADWQAEIELTSQGKSVDITVAWQPAHFRDFLPGLPPFVSNALLQTPIRSHIGINEKQLNSQHQLSLDTVLEHEQCHIALNANGSVTASYQLQEQTGQIDMADFPLDISVQHCSQLDDVPLQWRMRELQLLAVAPWMWQNDQLKTAEIKLLSHLPVALTLSATDIQVGTELLKGNVTLAAEHEQLQVNAFGRVSRENNHWQVADIQLDAKLASWQQSDMHLHDLVLNASGHYTQSLQLDAVLSIQQLQHKGMIAKALHSEIALRGDHWSDLKLSVSSELAQLTAGKFHTGIITNQLSAHVEQLADIKASGRSLVTKLGLPGLSLTPLTAEHQLTYQRASQQLISENQLEINHELRLQAKTHNTALELVLPQQSSTAFNTLLSELNPAAQLQAGMVSGELYYKLDTHSGTGQLALTNIDASYQNMTAQGVDVSANIKLDSAGFQIPPTKLQVKRVDTGVEISQIAMQLEAQQSQLRVTHLQAQLLGGEAKVPEIWADGRDQQINLSLSGIQLAKLMAVQQEAGVKSAGIEIDGQLQGSIPLKRIKGKISVPHASVKNMAPGVLKIENNSAFEALKAQQPHIGSQLALLEYLEFDSLNANVNMTEEGQVFVDMALKGINPQQQQPLNFNYTHQQNLYTLLKSLRLAKEIEQQLEHKTLQEQ